MKVVGAEEEGAIEQAVHVISGGGIVAIPTDTFYGLAANPFDSGALARLIAVKGREEGRGVLLLLSNIEMARTFAAVLPVALWGSRIWPGPVTVLCMAAPMCERLLTGGTGRIGLRIPDAPTVARLCDRLGHAITGTSANRAGAAPARCVADLDEIADGIDLALDGGTLTTESPSTVVDLTGPTPEIVRAGAVSLEWIVERLAGRRGEEKG